MHMAYQRPRDDKPHGPEVALLMIIFLPAFVLKTWVASKLWEWFVSPVFMVAVPPFFVLMGLLITASFFAWHGQRGCGKKESTFVSVANRAVLNLFILAVAYGVHLLAS